MITVTGKQKYSEEKLSKYLLIHHKFHAGSIEIEPIPPQWESGI